MPLFEFLCLECGLQFEKLVGRAGSRGRDHCPMCGSPKIDELISTFVAPASRTGADSRAGKCKPSG
jgi:putative FmdB family regulatory protein